jgi:IclR family pca regulon transcriptional regulator
MCKGGPFAVSRLPAFHTSLGRVQLGFLGEDELRRRLTDREITAYTASTITDPAALLARIMADHRQGYSIVDEELERGLRSIAVPIVSRSGRNFGAINLSALSSRTTQREIRERFLPELRAVAGEISATLA